jgi:hypothetical protein
MTAPPAEPCGTDAVPERWRLGASFVPKGRYTDVDFLRLEYERLFPRVWQMACREEDVADPGSFHGTCGISAACRPACTAAASPVSG